VPRHGYRGGFRIHGPRSRASTRRFLLRALALAAILVAADAYAQPYAVGDAIEPFTLEDQHGKSRTVDASVKVILFSRDMEGGDLLKEGLADVDPGYLDGRNAVYVADISRMPRLVARMFAIPAMRDRPYAMLLDRDGETTARLPAAEGQATLLFLDRLTVQRIAHVTEARAVRHELEGTADDR
jgi:hypothetical protein